MGGSQVRSDDSRHSPWLTIAACALAFGLGAALGMAKPHAKPGGAGAGAPDKPDTVTIEVPEPGGHSFTRVPVDSVFSERDAQGALGASEYRVQLWYSPPEQPVRVVTYRGRPRRD